MTAFVARLGGFGFVAATLFIFALPPAIHAESLSTEQGQASWYGKAFDGKPTASGETFDSRKLVAAHPEWPFNTLVRVTNESNDKAVDVRVTDRGPAEKVQRKGIIIDLSRAAAEGLDFVAEGVAPVTLEVLEWGGE